MRNNWRETYKKDLAALEDVPEEFREEYIKDLQEFKEYHENLEKEESLRRGKLIQIIRKHNNLTQAQLGSMCGMSASQIRNYELGFRNPKFETLNKIADALSFSRDFLYKAPKFMDDAQLTDEYISLYIHNSEYINENKKELAINIPLQVLSGYLELNTLGKDKVEKYIKELLELPEYTEKKE